jgi:proteic killer suppression protein
MSSMLPWIVIRSFADGGAADLFNGLNTVAARRACPERLRDIARRKLDHLDSALDLSDLRMPPGNRLEALRDDRRGQHSIRINDQYRICFRWTPEGPADVAVTDYH